MDRAALMVDHRLIFVEWMVAGRMLSERQAVAFGTVALPAKSTGTTGRTIIRLAAKLGLNGVSEFQGRGQELTGQSRPAQPGIREPASDDLASLALAFKLEHLHDILGRIDQAGVDAAVKRMVNAQAGF